MSKVIDDLTASLIQAGALEKASRFLPHANNYELVFDNPIAVYTNYNPVKYVDPSGHGPVHPDPNVKPDEDGGVIEVFAISVVTFIGLTDYDSRRRHEVGDITPLTICHDVLAECFQQNQISSFRPKQEISNEEFGEFLEVVYEGIDSRFRTAFDYSRSTYDTPFYTGNPSFGPHLRPDVTVLIGGNEYTQSEVNYVAQGMYSAKAGQKLEGFLGAEWLVKKWNSWVNNDIATEGEYYWLRYGYKYYNDRKADEERNSR